ncbi:hypothetical protein LguiB_007153 [Lonicera macranthoides]
MSLQKVKKPLWYQRELENPPFYSLKSNIPQGLGSALETLRGQAVGAGEFGKLGIYLQSSLLLNIITAVFLTRLYIHITITKALPSK